MNQFADWMISLIERSGVPCKHAKEVYVYGLALMVYTFLSTLGLLLIGAVAGRLPETALLVALFYTNQTHGGGFHAPSHLKCFLTMVLGLLLFLASFLLPLSTTNDMVMSFVSLVILYTHPLILHKNKAYLDPKSPQLIRKSRVIVLLESASFVLFLPIGDARWIHSFSFALVLCACSRMAAIGLRQGKSYS